MRTRIRPTVILLLAALLGACSPAASLPTRLELPMATSSVSAPDLPDLGAAPELHDGLWLNSQPLKLADLRGQVVLLEMWTFGCINCQHVTPHIREWYESYGGQGLVVIGNHYPEFNWEADLGNLQQALIDYDIPYPVLQDNDRQTWTAYHNHYWPTVYLIDKEGHIRYTHIGEGAYDQTEAAIQALLAEDYSEN